MSDDNTEERKILKFIGRHGRPIQKKHGLISIKQMHIAKIEMVNIHIPEGCHSISITLNKTDNSHS